MVHAHTYIHTLPLSSGQVQSIVDRLKGLDDAVLLATSKVRHRHEGSRSSGRRGGGRAAVLCHVGLCALATDWTGNVRSGPEFAPRNGRQRAFHSH